MTPRCLWIERWLLAALAGLLAALVALPLLALAVGSPFSAMAQAWRHPLVWPAVAVSLATTSVSLGLALLLGTPLAWLVAQSRRRWARGVEVLLELPLVLPPAVAGVALLMAFGRRGLVSQALAESGGLPFSTAAVVLAQTFVAAPLFVRAAVGAFARLDRSLIDVARSVGASPVRVLLQIAVPLAWPGLASGAALCWARAMGEFGATLLFAGNLEGVTQTLPLAIYSVMEVDLVVAQALALWLMALALAVLIAVRLGGKGAGADGRRVP